MGQLLQFVLLGLAAGSLYALTAHGLVLIYRGSGVLNFAQGAFAMTGAYAYHRVGSEHGWPTPLRFVVAVGVSAVLGVLTHICLMRPLRRASPLVRLVATLGLMFFLLALANAVFGDTSTSVRSPLPETITHPFNSSVSIGQDRLWLVVIVVVLTAVLAIGYRATRFGRSTEAVAENPRAAAALGYSPDVIAAANWALGGALAAVAGILIAPILLLQPATLSLTVLRALAAALVGRFVSFWGTLGGALGIGVAEALLARFVAHEGVFRALTNGEGLLFGLFSAQSVARSVAFIVIVVVMVVGGRALPMRGELLDRLPAVGTGRISWPWAGGALVLAIGLMLGVPDNWATALTISAASAIILLSIVIITGYVGQVSLAQVALAGMGTWLAGRLLDAYGVSFVLAAAAGVGFTVVLGTVLALPALRTRGMNLAVLTFGLAVCLYEQVLANPSLTGGLRGTRIADISLFGLDLDPFTHPARYGVLVLAVLAVLLVAVANLRRGPTGRRMIAVRNNERAAAALGVNVAHTKLGAFALAAGVAASGGILLAFRQHTVAYASFGTVASIQTVLLATIGGVGYIIGAIAGALLVPGGLAARVSDLVGLTPYALDVVSGALLLLTVITNPNGLVHRPARMLAGRRRRPGPSFVLAGEDETSPAVRPPRTLRVEDVSVRFGGVVAVDRVSLRLDPGTIVGIIGPNGAGKTTLLDAMTGFVAVAHGRVFLDEVMIDTWSASRRARAGIGRSFQSLELFEDLTVVENVLVACDQHHRGATLRDLVVPGTPTLSRTATSAVEDLRLADVLSRQPGELSYGTRRLVAIARALAASPAVVLLDEPAAGLSDLESAELGMFIKDAARRRDIAVGLIEHDMDLVMSICDRIVVLDAGQKIAEGTPEEIAADPHVAAAYLGRQPDVSLAAG